MNGTSDDELPELPGPSHSRSCRKNGFGEKSRAIATMLSWPSVLVLHRRTRPEPSMIVQLVATTKPMGPKRNSGFTP